MGKHFTKLPRIKSLDVYLFGEKVGELHKGSGFYFKYTTNDPSKQISPSLPLDIPQVEKFQLPAIFSINLQEGELKNKATKTLSKYFRVDEMALLYFCSKNQIGALEFIPQDKELDILNLSESEFDLDNLDDIDNYDLTGDDALSQAKKFMHALPNSGISGFQPKTLVPGEKRNRGVALNSNYIYKWGDSDFPGIAANEYLCMKVAEDAGLTSAHASLSKDNKVLCVERFDREGIDKIHFEDACSLTGYAPVDKYDYSYEDLAELVENTCKKEDLKKLFEHIALSCLVGDGDAHMKNFGFLKDSFSGEYKISPIYDVVNTSIYSFMDRRGDKTYDRTMALSFNRKKNFPNKVELIRFGKEFCKIDNACEIIDNIIESMNFVLEENRDLIYIENLNLLEKRWNENINKYENPKTAIQKHNEKKANIKASSYLSLS